MIDWWWWMRQPPPPPPPPTALEILAPYALFLVTILSCGYTSFAFATGRKPPALLPTVVALFASAVCTVVCCGEPKFLLGFLVAIQLTRVIADVLVDDIDQYMPGAFKFAMDSDADDAESESESAVPVQLVRLP